MSVYDELFPDGSKFYKGLHPTVKAICALADEVRALRVAWGNDYTAGLERAAIAIEKTSGYRPSELAARIRELKEERQ